MKNKIILMIPVACLFVFRMSLAADCFSEHPQPELVRPPNLVVEPEYTAPKEKKKKADECPFPPPQKLQYEPADAEPVLLEEREGENERKNGVEYRKGRELFVTPQPDYVVKDEDIQDPPEPSAPEKETPVLLASPNSNL